MAHRTAQYINNARAQMKTTRNERHQILEHRRKLEQLYPGISPVEMLARLYVGCKLRALVRQLLRESKGAKRRRKRNRQRRRRRVA